MYKKKDFSFTYCAEGYMLQYKGRNIGGVSIKGTYKGRQRDKQCAEHKEYAKREIERICSGIVPKYMLANINKIDGVIA